MQKILIIGNGFDLHHHLPTKYEHFIKALESIENSDENSNYSFNEIFKTINDEFKQQIINSYETEKINFANEKVEKIKIMLKHNVWYQCFKHINNIDTWIDFETQIEKILNIVNDFFKVLNEFIVQNRGLREIRVSTFKPQHTIIVINPFQYNIISNLKINIALRNNYSIGVIDKNYYLVENNEIYGIDEKKIFDDLSKSLEEFIEIFNLYLTYIIEPFYDCYYNIELIKDTENKKCSILKTNEKDYYQNRFIQIYSFNYTPTIQKYYQSNSINFIHGNSGKLQNMVLGINDINEELKEHKMFAFTKYYQKLYKKTDFNFLENDIDFEDDTRIFIWGHSLDQSDGEYIKKIFDLFLVTVNSVILIIFYHDNLARASQLQNLLKIMDKQPVENAIKSGQLAFVESTNENLFNMINIREYDLLKL